MPLVTPTDYYIENDAAQHLSSLSLFDNQQQVEHASQLLNSTEAHLVDVLARSLSQIDTSKLLEFHFLNASYQTQTDINFNY